jgi:hypothetical protein
MVGKFMEILKINTSKFKGYRFSTNKWKIFIEKVVS